MLLGYIITYVQVYFYNFLKLKNMIFKILKRKGSLEPWSPKKQFPWIEIERCTPCTTDNPLQDFFTWK
jgi:hypothetical protein